MSDSERELEEAAELERQTLWILLAINGLMFVAESLGGWLGESTGLLADSVDMFADASIYGIALYAAGRLGRLQANAARLSGVIQIALGVGVLFEVARRFSQGSEPASSLMILVGSIALAANLICVALIRKHREGGVHMRASWIFSINDVIANLGVIISGILVMVLDSRIPDLAIGAFVSLIVVRGGIQILREAREAQVRES